jgi:hypothetical protein
VSYNYIQFIWNFIYYVTSRRVESEVGKKLEATGATRDKLLGFGSHNDDEILLLL